jgi:FPC/CPF motif-containing protein YcgG
MIDLLSKFISGTSFPCIMAKSLIKKGYLDRHNFIEINGSSTEEIKKSLYEFIDEYRRNPKRLSSFIISFDHPKYDDFSSFESGFWDLLKGLRMVDTKVYKHDSRVNANPHNEKYSFSMKEEAFFILLLHKDSPRFARQFKIPTIVFNPHQQFEEMRIKGIFNKVRNFIREKDLLLQGKVNSMLSDFGSKSEIYQYTGRSYQESEDIAF